MNLKVLGKAMGFMFLPTLGVLLMLVVGFFDPIAMWNWIKSNDGWAIFVRIVLFLLETGLVVVMYFYYLDEETKKQAFDGKGAKNGERRNSRTEICDLYRTATSRDAFRVFETENANIRIVELIKES